MPPEAHLAPEPQSANRRIFRAALTISVWTFGVRALGLAKEPVVAAIFGTGDAMDAFVMAFLLPMFVINITSSAFTATFVPAYIRVRDEDGPERAGRFLSSALLLSVGLLAAFALFLFLFGESALSYATADYPDEKKELTKGLLLCLLPMLLIKGVSTLWAAVLQSHERFALAAAAPAAIPICIVASLLLWRGENRIYALALGTVAGYAVEMLILGAVVRGRGFDLLPRWSPIDERVRAAIGQYLPILAGSMINAGAMVIDRMMASSLTSGSVSSLNYGHKFIDLALTIAATALGTAVLPYLSRMVAAGDRAGLRRTMGVYVRGILWITVPASVVLFFSADTIVGLFYERGTFTAEDTRVVADVLRWYSFQIPTYLLGIVVARFLSAVRRNQVLMIAAVLLLPANVALNLILMPSMGVAGIALSTSIVYVIAFLYSGGTTWRMLRSDSDEHWAAIR